MKTLIRLLLWEQSDLGLHCLPRPMFPKLMVITVYNILIINLFQEKVYLMYYRI